MKEQQLQPLPYRFEIFISQKLKKSNLGGRPHFIKKLANERDPKEEVLKILEYVWLKGRSIQSIARKYYTTYQTIWRLLQDLDPWKTALISYLELVPRRKIFYNKDRDSSGYDSVASYIRRAKRDQVKHYKRNILLALKCWRFLKYKDPERWTAEEVQTFLNVKSEGSQALHLDAIRMVAPQIKDPNSIHYIKTTRYREKLKLRKKDLFLPEVKMVLTALRSQGLAFHELIFKLHITTGAREGSTDLKSGLTGLTWNRFKRDFNAVDLFESKSKGGIWWRNCPLTLFFRNLPNELKALWIQREKPLDEKLLRNYHELLGIYKEIRSALKEFYRDLADPSLFEELTTLRPHDADKIHVNLLWEAGIPLEVLAGKYLGRGEAVGLFGRGWLSIDTLRKHYLSLTERSKRIQNLRKQVHACIQDEENEED